MKRKPECRRIGGGALWACYRSLSGKERNDAAFLGFDEECYFTVNWRSDITPGQRVIFRGKVYEITRVDDFEGYKKDLRLTCKWLPLEKPECFKEDKKK